MSHDSRRERGEARVEPDGADDGNPLAVTRRGALGLLGLGGLSLVAESATAQQRVTTWEQNVDAGGRAVFDLGGLSTTTNQTTITDFAGANLSIDRAGVLNADLADVSDDGHPVVTGPRRIDAGAGLSARADSSGTGVTLAVKQGTGSGLDADTLDGSESTAFAPSEHHHAGESLTPQTIQTNSLTADSARVESLSVGQVGAAVSKSERQVFTGYEANPVIEWDRVEFVHPEVVTYEDSTFTIRRDGIYDIRVQALVTIFLLTHAEPIRSSSARIRVVRLRDGLPAVDGETLAMGFEGAPDQQSETVDVFEKSVSITRVVPLQQGDRIQTTLLIGWGQTNRQAIGGSLPSHMSLHRLG